MVGGHKNVAQFLQSDGCPFDGVVGDGGGRLCCHGCMCCYRGGGNSLKLICIVEGGDGGSGGCRGNDGIDDVTGVVGRQDPLAGSFCFEMAPGF